MLKKIFLILLIPFVFNISQNMTFEEYDPPSTLVVPETKIYSAKFPFIDVHNHQWNVPNQDLLFLKNQMDSLNMSVMVNLSGRSFKRTLNADSSYSYGYNGVEYVKNSIDKINKEIPGRIIAFTNVDFNNIDDKDWISKTLNQLETDVKNGAQGLKIYKSLGMTTKDKKGDRVKVDDKRIDPIWEKCGELGIPVLIHSAEPAQFWQPHDNQNERWLELKEKPNRKRDPKEFTFEQVISEQHNVFRKHPNTKFINAHLGWMANDLEKLGKHLDEFPNVYTEIAAVIAELGRQPRFAKKFLTKYQDRVMFGKDTWRKEEYYLYFRVLETSDEYIKYFRRRHAFWRLYGLELSDEVLKKIYYKNAINVIPGIDKTRFPD